jgi:1-acyl-sn-glycerol-3-phosphate acyltransferase
VGLENLKNFSGGAVITCNHINIMDNFIVLLGLDRHFKNLKKANKMYKIVREGNYSQTGMIGQCLRYCDTLPVDASGANWRLNAKSMEAVKVLLSRGKKVLIYPEQSMWWNYKKPRPQKIGAFAAAAKSAVPIIPCFITMKETDKIGADGFAVMEYTLHILPLIAPAEKEIMRAENEKLWAEVYERVYKC